MWQSRCVTSQNVGFSTVTCRAVRVLLHRPRNTHTCMWHAGVVLLKTRDASQQQLGWFSSCEHMVTDAGNVVEHDGRGLLIDFQVGPKMFVYGWNRELSSMPCIRIPHPPTHPLTLTHPTTRLNPTNPCTSSPHSSSHCPPLPPCMHAATGRQLHA
jgi:hypothetical protein